MRQRPRPRRQVLYHFTSISHWPKIWQDGRLALAESNVSRTADHAGPDVVWLTTREAVGRGEIGLAGSAVDKSRVRFTVEVSAEKWFDFAGRYAVDRNWRNSLEAGNSPGTWRVTETEVGRDAWVEVRDMKTNQVLWEPGMAEPAFPLD